MINEKIELGRLNRLIIDRITDPGMYLMAQNGEAILLPNRYITDGMKIGNTIDVFVATDSEDRLVALTDKPFAMLDEFGYFEVVDTTSFGAFVDWGLPKDLFVPKRNQKVPFKTGDKRILRVIYDDVTDRLTGDEHTGKYLLKQCTELEAKEKVKLLILTRTPLGFKVIVNNKYEGMIYHSEIFSRVWVGQRVDGYVKNLRDDGKLDISLQPIGEARKDAASQKVLAILKKNGGQMKFNYKSDAEEITKVFGLSKKNFKFALTKLLGEAKIELTETGMVLKC